MQPQFKQLLPAWLRSLQIPVKLFQTPGYLLIDVHCDSGCWSLFKRRLTYHSRRYLIIERIDPFAQVEDVAHIDDPLAALHQFFFSAIPIGDGSHESGDVSVGVSTDPVAAYAESAGVGQMMTEAGRPEIHLGMPAGSGIHLVACRGRILGSGSDFRVVHPRFLSADVYGEFLRTLADFLCGNLHTVGEYITKTLSLNHFLQHFDDRPVISPGEFDAVGIRFRDNTILIALHREGDGS